MVKREAVLRVTSYENKLYFNLEIQIFHLVPVRRSSIYYF
jgi:hypothetical protein